MAEHHGDCAQELQESWAKVCAEEGGSPPTEITISTEPPLVANPYITGMQCPHGVKFWIEPTGDQIARWRKEASDA